MKNRFKEGAASFYIVAFSTLILVIVAMSFIAIIVSEITRTSNDDLSQSAYDSALAGIEDAKLAVFNYQNCIENGINTGQCKTIRETMEAEPACDMVRKMLNREDGGDGAVVITESSGDNNMMQAYTCVKVIRSLPDYRSTLSETNPMRVVRVKLDDDQAMSGNGLQVSASDIKRVRVSWYSDSDGTSYQFTNFNNGNVTFPSLSTSKASTPPTIAVQLVQTAGEFKVEDFTMSVGDRTNRGIVYLVPTMSSARADKSNNKDTYIGAYNGSKNVIGKEGLVKSNDKTVNNKPYAVYCNTTDTSEFLCSADIELPEPVGTASGGARSDETFMFVVSIPYGKPSTDFALEFFCGDDGSNCAKKLTSNDAEVTVTEETTNQINLKGVQISIDSTGRANDLYRRVETRLETADTSFAFPLYGIQLLDTSGSGYSLEKDLTVTAEHNF